MTFDGVTLNLIKTANNKPNIEMSDSSTRDPYVRIVPDDPDRAYAVGIDYSDNYKFKISYGLSAVLGTSDRLTIDTNGKVGIANNAPDKILDVSGDYRFASAPNTELDNSDVGYGEVVYIGSSTTTAGRLYYLDAVGGWSFADANAVSSSSGMLAIAMGSNSGTDGMLIRGFYRSSAFPSGNIGDILYVSTAVGDLSRTAPTATGDVVRIVGYIIGTTTNTRIYFNPSSDWIEL
jgi:hypothetical protein